MIRKCGVLLVLAWGLTPEISVFAQEPAALAGDPDYQRIAARMSVDPGWVSEQLKALARGRSDPEEKVALEEKRLEALCRAGRFEVVLDYFSEESEKPVRSDTAEFWRGLALYSVGDRILAAGILELLALKDEFPFRRHALRTLVRHWASTKDYKLALAGAAALIEEGFDGALLLEGAVLAILARQLPLAAHWLRIAEIPEGGPLAERRRLLECALAAAEGDWDAALSLSEAALDGGATSTWAPWFRLWKARAAIEDGNRAAAAGLVIETVEEAPASRLLGDAFSMLQACGPRDHPPIAEAVQRWTRSPGSLGELARFYAVVWFSEDQSKLRDTLRAAVQTSAHPARGVARLRLAEQALRIGLDGEGYQQLAELREDLLTPEMLGEAVFLEGRARFEGAQFDQAQALFQSRHLELDRYAAYLARFNLGLIALAKNAEDAFESEIDWLRRRDDRLSHVLVEELAQTRALHEASLGSRRAPRLLEEAIAAYPRSGRAPDLQLALAEWHALADPPQRKKARQALTRIEDGGSKEIADRRSALSVLMDAWENPAEPEVAERLGRMAGESPPGYLKDLFGLTLGKILLSRGREREAFEAFLAVSRLAEGQRRRKPAQSVAAILAGGVALRLGDPGALNEAVTALGNVIGAGGMHSGAARLMQARVLAVSGSEREALAQLQFLTDQDALGEPLVRRATMLRGEMLFRQAAAAAANRDEAPIPDPAEGLPTDSGARMLLESAVEVFGTLDTEDAPVEVRQEALYRQGRAFEKTPDTVSALRVYFKAVELGGDSQARSPWFYRAGFRALGILENQGRWESAILLAEKLTVGDGAEGREAREVLNRLRLRHMEL